MTRQVVMPRSPTLDRRLLNPHPPPRQSARVAEVAGATAAECAAVCCCCPCSIAGLIVLAVYKVPAGLCRRALRNRKRRRRRIKCSHGGIEGVEETGAVSTKVAMEERLTETEMDEFEEEMLKTFYGRGFWRSSRVETELTTGVDSPPAAVI